MNRESVIALISGTFFGILVGWILGSQHAGPSVAQPPAAASASTGSETTAPPLDLQKAADLEKTAKAQPQNAAVRIELANLYYDAQRFDLATPWYEAALTLNPNNVEASTDLAVAYYNQNQTDRALTQIDRSLKVDPKHTKTLLNQGIIRAFGKRDLAGAVESWQRVVDVAPNSEDAAQARRAIQDVKANHPGSGRGGEAPAPDSPGIR